ncbi:MAG TPA: hypothetical protein VKR42_12695 [Ktedonobacteraceae bacterium]|nr:hypothetical protein [Ktedonobacteraceae bacterium]
MNFIIGFSLIAGIISAVITIYLFIEARLKHQGFAGLGITIIFSVVTIVMLLLAGFLTYLPTSTVPGNNSSGIKQGVTASSTGNGIEITPTPIPTPSPTPSPIPKPKPGVLYQENGSDNWQGWALSSDWRQVTGGLLISNGDGGGSTPSAVAPYTLPAGMTNFEVQASIRTPATSSQWWDYGINGCGSTSQGSWTGYVGRISKDYSASVAILTAEISNDSHNDVATANFDAGTDWHTYTLKIQGNVLTFLIDGAPVANGNDEEYISCGNQVGFYDGGGVQREVQVRNFEVIAL